MNTSPATPPPSVPESQAKKALAVGGFSALLASACCLGPLLLISIGLSGAWLRYFSIFEPYGLYLTGITALALLAAGWSIWKKPNSPQAGSAACEEGQACARAPAQASLKIGFGVVVVLFVLALFFTV